MGGDGVNQSCIIGGAMEERGEEDGGGIQLRPRSLGLVFTLRHPDNVGLRGGFGKQEQMNTWNASSFQRRDGLTSKTGIFGSQAGSERLRGFSINSCSTGSCSSCSTYSSCSSCSSQEAKGWSSRSPPKELYKYI